MSYFLKKTPNKKGIYLQIYEGYYDPQIRDNRHRSIKPLGYVHELEAKGIEDPIAYYKDVAKKMNIKKKEEKAKHKERKITTETPERDLGYFIFKSVIEGLGVNKDLSYFDLAYEHNFKLYDLINQLIYARVVYPCSKQKTFHDVLPLLYEKSSFSKSQMYTGLGIIGNEYERIIEVYNNFISKVITRNTDYTYFDGTNFYFEIDKEDSFKKNGPSKENKNAPIVGLGLLLDADQIPLGMKLFPGNESEKPKIREVINNLKKKNCIKGRTIRVADKGLNCADNIAEAKLNGDGYIFSKSIKQLSEQEQRWAISPEGFVDYCDENGEIVYSLKEIIDEFDYNVTNKDGKKSPVSLKEKRIVTYNSKLAKKQIREINKMVEKSYRLCISQAKRKEFGECSKFVTFTTQKNPDEKDNKVISRLNHKNIDKAKELAGYNMIVTSELKMKPQEIYCTYHNLWRIEESFRVMKSQLDARPVYLQKKETITGHFLICYLSVLILRLLQFKIFSNKFSSEDIIEFVRNFRVVESSVNKNINISKMSEMFKEVERITGISITNYYLTKSDITKLMKYKFTKDNYKKKK